MSQRSYKTSKGTDLPLLNLRGKEYLEVKYRIVWFREEHPDWSIETELLSVTDVSSYAKATIRDEKGRIITTSHKFENVQGFPDFIEKAETGAIGRALALIGYGTQFCADELDEGNRLADAPITPPAKLAPAPGNPAGGAGYLAPAGTAAMPTTPAATGGTTSTSAASSILEQDEDPREYVIQFGRKYKGRKLGEIPRLEVEGYLEWLASSSVRPGTVLAHQVQILKSAVARLYPDGGNVS